MAVLTAAELVALARAAGAEPPLAHIMAAAALAESGGDTEARGDRDPVTGEPHSVGLFQMHDQGAGAGWSVADRCDPHRVVPYMFRTEFLPAFQEGLQRGYRGEQLAAWTYMRAERPAGWRGAAAPGLDSPAAQRFLAHWRALAVLEAVPGTGAPASGSGEPAELRALRMRVLAIALEWSLARVPYVLAPDATTRERADCSGFVVGVFREAGLPFPAHVRVAEQLRQACPTVVPWEAVQPGDLLFFQGTYEPCVGASHVGFSRGAGTRQMLDTNDVRGYPGVTDIGTAYWQEHLWEARRPPQFEGATPAPAPADLAAQLAAERSFSSALMHDVIGVARAALEQARQAGDWAQVDPVIELLRRHEA